MADDRESLWELERTVDLAELRKLEDREDAGEVLEGYSKDRKDELTMRYGNRSERSARTPGMAQNCP